MSGLTAEGFLIETLADIRDGIIADLRDKFGPNIMAEDELLGELVASVSERYSLLWEALEAVYSSQDPDKATGQALVALCALTGTLPEEATPSLVTLTLTGDDGTAIVTGKVVSVEGTGIRFALTADATLALVADWATGHAYSLGDRVKNGGNVYQCITAGTSAGSGGPTTTDDDISDNTAHWAFLGEGEAAADVDAESEQTGQQAAAARTLTVIETPVAGWDGAINLASAELGEVGDDPENRPADLRVRRENELRGNGKSTHEAIRAAVLRVEGVFACTVFSNEESTTNSDGMPPHSIEVLVRGGDDDDILQAIFDSKPEGIATTGTETGTVTGSDGLEHTIKFSRADEVDIYIDATLTVDPDLWPEDGEDQVVAMILSYGDLIATGKDVVSSALAAQIFKVSGVIDASPVKIGLTASPSTTTTIAISLRELAVFDEARISLTVNEGTP